MKTLRLLSRTAFAIALYAGGNLPAAAAPARETVTPQFQHSIPNISDKTLTAVLVEYPPGAKSLSHHHAPSAFIYVYVLSGAVRSQVDDQPAKIYRAGESFYETPQAHHKISENASDTEPARMLAVFVANTGESLTTPDQQ